MNWDKLEKYRAEIVSFKSESLKNLIDYYENNYLPHMVECHGYSQHEAAGRKRKELQKLQEESKRQTPLKYLDISKSEVMNALRAEAIRCREQARDFRTNPHIVMRGLRKAVSLVKQLIEIEPKLEIYSLHWLCSRQPITIN